MANAFYNKGIEAFLEGSVAALTDTIKANLVTTGYTPSLSADQFHSTITSSGGIVGSAVALSGKSGSAGTLSASNVIFTAVSGSQCAYIPLWKDTTIDATSPLLCLFDTATGLPVTPNGGDITVAWASSQIFTLCEGLPDAAKEPGLIRQIWEWLNEIVGVPAVRGKGGIWMPSPVLVQTPRLILES